MMIEIKEYYEKPVMEIVEFETEDVIQISLGASDEEEEIKFGD